MRKTRQARRLAGGSVLVLMVALAAQPVLAAGGMGGAGGGHAGGGLGGGRGLGGPHGGLRYHPPSGGVDRGVSAGGFGRTRDQNSGFGQNGDGLSDYAPYGRPVDGCDPGTPARVRYRCSE